MPKWILMPSLSPTMEEGKIASWNKREGDRVESGDIIAEIETDKAVMEYEAVEEGILGEIVVAEGSEGVKVNSPIGVLLLEGEDKAALEKFKEENKINSATPQNETKVDKPNDKIEPNSNNHTYEKSSDNSHTGKDDAGFSGNSNTSTAASNTRIFISPLAKVVAAQARVDLTKIVGSGPRGRIIKQDVLNFIKNGGEKYNTSQYQASAANNVSPYNEVSNSGMRKTIAKRLLESKTSIPHYYLSLSCNVTALLKAREEINVKSNGAYKISVNDFIIKAVGLAMKNVPEANSSWQGDTTKVFNQSDVAVAVAVPNGLITPVVRNTTNKGLIEISKEMKELAAKAKEGKLAPHEYQGGGFSISNLGMFGIEEFYAIINPPQAGILAIGATVKKPVVVNDAIVIANMLTINLSADHRVMDGAVGAKFLNLVKQYLENPVAMVL